ncbi:uncharacterized protein LOC132164703 [Corylus avellana]|uniref:uncharacterized protein LOC132164703 n=1 Tax=Corylus avellana TaxID=13451 RepID=UPI00286A7EAD|nr:uncharacterized protein LOC132164703 [Corylus avellana]
MSSTVSIQQNLSPLLSLGTLCKSLAISGLVLFLFYTFLFNPPNNYQPSDLLSTIKQKWPINIPPTTNNIIPPTTNINHIVFGIVGSMNTWKYKNSYSAAWWQPNITRGYLFLDRAPTPEFQPWPSNFPPFRVNEDVSKLRAFPRMVRPMQVRIVRTIMELFRQGDKNVRWYVMADDDTVLFVDNLVGVLAKYNHSKYYYIGSNSECVKSNFDFSFDMAFGGAGYALSYPLVEALAAKLDACIERYPYLYVSDFMLHSCLADLGVPLTHHKGFHQIDLVNDISGLLSAHPQFPFLSLHHIDTVDPIFPSMNRSEAINHLMKAAKADQSRLLQQTICYHRPTNWSFSISWGYSTYIYENIIPRSILWRPLETFRPWARNARPPLYMFNTRWLSNNGCEAPHVFFLDSIGRSDEGDQIVTTYIRKSARGLPPCSFTGNHSADPITKIQVFSPATTRMEAGGRDCCDIVNMGRSNNITEVKYRACMKDEVIA